MEGYVVFSQRRSDLGRAGSQLYEGTQVLPSKAAAVSRAAKTSVAGQEDTGRGSAAIRLLSTQDRWVFQAGMALRGLWLMCPPMTFLPHCLQTGLREMALPHVPGKEYPSIGQLVGPRGECLALGRTSRRLTGQGLGAA